MADAAEAIEPQTTDTAPAPEPEAPDAPAPEAAPDAVDAPDDVDPFANIFKDEADSGPDEETVRLVMDEDSEPDADAPEVPDEPAENDNDDPPPLAAEADDAETADDPEGDDAKTDAPEEADDRTPPWRRKMVERKEAQATRVETQYQQQLAQMQQLHAAQLEAMNAKLEALAAKRPEPVDDAPKVALTGDLMKDLEVLAKAHGKTGVTDLYATATERLANDGEPTAKEMYARAQKLVDEKFGEFEKYKSEVEAQKAEMAKQREQLQYQQHLQQGATYVAEKVDHYAFWWKEHVPQTVLSRTIQAKTQEVLSNQRAIEQQLGRRVDDNYVTQLVDEELSSIYAKFNPDVDTDSNSAPPRVKDTRREQAGKPARAGSRRTRSVTSKDAAASPSRRTITDAEREAVGDMLLRKAIGG